MKYINLFIYCSLIAFIIGYHTVKEENKNLINSLQKVNSQMLDYQLDAA